MGIDDKSGSIVESGTCGTAQWELCGDGALLVHDGTIDRADQSLMWKWPWKELGDRVTSVRFAGVKGGKSLAGLLGGMANATSMDLSDLDTGDTQDMRSMFESCKSLESLDLSSFDTRQVTEMAWMFSDCPSLRSIDLSSFDTGSVTDMSCMFQRCASLESLGLSSFDTSSLQATRWMFASCSSLGEIALPSHTTSCLRDLREMFLRCSSLREIDLSGFELPVRCQYLTRLFWGCSSLGRVSMPRWDREDAYYVEEMFHGTKVSGITVHREGGSLFLDRLTYDLPSCWIGWRGQVSRGVDRPLQCVETGEWHTVASAKRDSTTRDSSTYVIHPALLD